jgi:AcrR family transcriptional regulator
MKTKTRKDQIIQISASLFKEKGFSAVTMRDIAKTMGIKAASLYNHIASKQEILSEIIISLAQEFTQRMKAIKKSNHNCIEKLNQIVALHVNITSSKQFEMASLNNDWMHLEENLDYYLTLRKNYEDDFRQIIQEGIDHGELVDGNAEVMLFSVLSTLRSLYIWLPSEEVLNADELAMNLSQVLINGISK